MDNVYFVKRDSIYKMNKKKLKYDVFSEKWVSRDEKQREIALTECALTAAALAKQSVKPAEKKQQNKQKNKLMTLTACQGQLFGKVRAVVSAGRWKMTTFTKQDNAKEKSQNGPTLMAPEYIGHSVSAVCVRVCECTCARLQQRVGGSRVK